MWRLLLPIIIAGLCVGCTGSAEPTPTQSPSPTPTPNVEATVAVIVASQVASQATPTPAATATQSATPYALGGPPEVIGTLIGYLWNLAFKIPDEQTREWFNEQVGTILKEPDSREFIYLGPDAKGDEVWHVRSSYLGMESLLGNQLRAIAGTWEVKQTLGRWFARPADTGAEIFDREIRAWAEVTPR